MSNSIPLPSPSILTRWLIPAAIIGSAIAALGLASFRSFRPATPVRVASAIALPRSTTPSSDSESPRGAATAATTASSPAASSGPARWVQAPGWIEPDPQPVVASALRDGIVEQILVLEGDRVEREAPVARLESRSAALAHARAKAELLRAEAERERRLAMAEQARTELAQLPFVRAAAQARFDAAHDAADRADRLAATHAMGESEVVRLRNARLEARADLESIEPRERAIAAAIRAADAEAAAVTLVPQAMLEEAALALERSTVRSPIDGVVMEVHATPGQNLFAGDMSLGRAVVSLYDPRRLRVRADVPLSDAAGLGIGQRARVTVEILPDRIFDGVVTRLVHKADIQKNTVGVKVTLTDPSTELKPDMLARVRIEVGGAPGPVGMPGQVGSSTAASSAAALPSTEPARVIARADALTGEGAERQALVVTGIERGRGVIEVRRVRVGGGSPREGWLAITEGLAPGDRIVVAPAPGITQGTVVEIVENLVDQPEAIDATR